MMKTVFSKISRIAANAMAIAILSACGGGGGTPAPQAAQPPPTGGIEGSGIAIGTITGFGSIFVNGVEFSTSNASIVVEGQPATEDRLAVGQVVFIEGSIDDNGLTGRADRVEYDDILEGPVTSIDLTAGSLVILGQTVLTDADTSFDDRIVPNSLNGLSVGATMEISGYLDSSGAIRATRIQPDDEGDEFEIEGLASNVNSGSTTFTIASLTINYGAAVLEGFPNGAPENGQFVEVHGSNFNAGSELLATRVEFEDGDFDQAENDEVEIEGLITRFVSASDFDVSGQPVTTNAQTLFENGTLSDLAENVKVEAEGIVNAASVLVAEKIEFRLASNVEIEALAESVNNSTGTVTLLGIPVSVDSLTRMEDDSDARVQSFSLANINPGDFLSIRGSEQPPGSNAVLASRLERDEAESSVLLQGAVTSVSPPDDFTILGVTIHTDVATEFRTASETPITKADFFADASGRLVKARGSWDGSTLLAEEVEFEN